jgi:SH3-like domain-containing protein
MRGAPGGDADAVGGVATGDVVRLGEMRDGWRRVRHADGRDGWLPDARLRALTVPTADR